MIELTHVDAITSIFCCCSCDFVTYYFKNTLFTYNLLISSLQYFSVLKYKLCFLLSCSEKILSTLTMLSGLVIDISDLCD